MNFKLLSDYINKAHSEISAGNYDSGILFCKKALDINPNQSEAWFNLGLAHKNLGDNELATDSFLKSSGYAPHSCDAQNASGLALLELGRIQEAEACFAKAISINSSDPASLSNLGLIRKSQGNLKEAGSLFIKAIQLAPHIAALYVNLAGILNKLNLFTEATHASKKAIQISPTLAEAWNNLSISLGRLNQNKEALDAAREAIKLNQDINWLLGGIVYLQLKICDWRSLGTQTRRLAIDIENGRTSSEPIVMLSVSSVAETQKKCASIYSNALYLNDNPIPPKYANKKIRVGYVSSDFGTHAVSFLITGLIEHHNRDKFEIFGYDTGAHSDSTYRIRLIDAFDHFRSMKDLSTNEMIQCIRNDQIDILIDLNGHTKDSVTDVFAARPASVQINFIGYPGTMGAQFIDYIVGDKILIPATEATHYSEKIIYLPECFQPNDSKRVVAAIKSRETYGINPEAFVFGCFNQSAKIVPEIFHSWVSILENVPNSILWLAIQDLTARNNLQAYADHTGFDTTRIIFTEHSDYAEHLAKHKLVDLMLDTYPFNGGTTTSDALWCGTPVLTLHGDAFASRMGASLLRSMGLDELVTSTLQEYKAKAIYIGSNPDVLVELRDKLSVNLTSSPLFDTQRYARHFEKGLEMAILNFRSGLLPDHINVTTDNFVV